MLWHQGTWKFQYMCAWHTHSSEFIDTEIQWFLVPKTYFLVPCSVVSWVWQTSRNRKKETLNLSIPVTFCFLFLSFEHSSTQGKEAQSASVSAKDHRQHLSFRVLGQNSYHSKGTRCLIRKIRNVTLLLQIVISGSVRTQRKRTRRFLFNASCLIFFYYYVQRFFYTKKLNAVWINSVCSFSWGSSKSEDFVRSKCTVFFF